MAATVWGLPRVTKFVASTCDGTDLCNYRVYYKNMGGDPSPGCKKAFRANYVCGKNRKPETCDLQAEAGMGLPSTLFDGRLARTSEGQTERGENSSRCRSLTTDSTSGHTKYPITIVTMAMAVSRPPNNRFSAF